MSIIKNFINGIEVESTSTRITNVYNPATGDVINKVKLSTATEVNNAIDIANKAFISWSKVSPVRRARIIFKFKELFEIHFDELAEIITREHGKIYSDAIGELNRGLEVIEFASGIPHLLKGEHSNNVGTGIDTHSIMQPLGVVSGITPFNFPAMVPMWMWPIAIACGNTFILKPSEKDPSVSLKIANLLKKSGLPDGVFNVIHGDKEAVDAILENQYIKAVSFVGSTPIAKYIYSHGSLHGKRVQALGGAKNHSLIMPDANIEIATNALLGAAFGAAGERCMAISVAVTIDDNTADKLINNLKNKIIKLKIGPGHLKGDLENDMGPIISAEHRQKIIDYINTGINEKANLILDGRNLTIEGYEKGYFLGPSLFDNVTKDMTIYKDEIFGPVLCIVRTKNYQEAIDLINSHQFGNGSAIFTNDGNTAREFTNDVQAGMVGINVPIPVPIAFHCFGGWKESAFGALNAYGIDGVRFYTKMKTVTTRWPSKKLTTNNAEFTMPTH